MRLSIIIPAYCEADQIAGAVRCARAIGGEVIVVDGSSSDATADLAKRAGARVLVTRKSRGHQLHRGACAATGDVLVFLHADTRLPPTAATHIEDVLSDPEVHGGNFRVAFTLASRTASLFSWGIDIRRRWMRIYYGDSAIFVRRAAYEALGGFKPLPVLEDYEFVRRLERRYRTRYVRELAATTSARRFEGRAVRTFAIWFAIQGLYSLGMSPQRLARLYVDLR